MSTRSHAGAKPDGSLGMNEAGGASTGEGPPASLYAAFQCEGLVFKEFLFVCNNEV